MVAARWSRRLAGIVLVLIAQTVLAAPSFIAGTKVTGNDQHSTIAVRFNCQISNLQQALRGRGDRLRIRLDPTTICNGVSPLSAQSYSRLRPAEADLAALVDLVYEGDAVGGPTLTLNFSESIAYRIEARALAFDISIHVARAEAVEDELSTAAENVLHRQVIQPGAESRDFVVNLASYQRIPTIADVSGLNLGPGDRVFYSELNMSGKTWYRVRLGPYRSSDEAMVALSNVVGRFADAWVDQIDDDSSLVDLTTEVNNATASDKGKDKSLSKIDQLMDEARLTMVSGDRQRAIQIYTKILQLPDHPRQVQAQEYLALAREKNGQTAHAKAEYQRYLSLYPESEGAGRVKQRLAALLSSGTESTVAGATSGNQRRRRSGDWRLQTFFSQYYRRDVNQQNDQDETVSQSALYSDMNLDVRRRGERFDFSSRVTAGYRNDFLGTGTGGGDGTRVSYAYADLADAKTGLRGRLGRQSRNTGGVLGRFDGINLGYLINEQTLINAVVGKPAYSSNDGIDSERTFYGISVDYGPVWDNLELGLFFISQDIDGISDRQAVGGEFRYFGETKSIWGLVDYDTQYSELSSAFLQTSWRLSSKLSVNGSIDRRHSPFLSAGNAIIGQPVLNFSELMQIFSEAEIRQLGLDRSPLSTSYSVGVSYTLSPKLQISADANQTTVDESPATGGVLATPRNQYRYFAANIIASSLLREGDVTIVALRQSDSDTSKVLSLHVDSRYPFSRTLRINPRLRVDRRERIGEPDYEWIYTPGIRIQYRRSQKFRFEFEAGKQFSQRDTGLLNLDRESYFINLGYQVFF